ncbi:hypothetical protein N7478_010683 [Penicillium angulare]|uniref:uncharacterized protein n=1 Tax=Penicillium angulare TaxID=116970 RepID=UPI0025421105|nr:uncharacterized protein N7478_010683 [Penicillium angulare]KAJ5267875.1 hypothetical protein N7478_010683 [Penicillium angulare]
MGLTAAQDLIVSIKAFNLIGGTSVPKLSREAKVNEQGLWDSGSLVAAAFTKFAEVQQTLLAILSGKGMAVPDQSQQTQPTVAETLRAIDTSADSSAMEPLQNQPKFVHINSFQDAAKAEGDYAKLTTTMKSFADTLAGKLKEVWMQKYIQLLRPTLEEMATLLDNLGAYLEQATSSEFAGNCIKQQREILEASLNHTIQTCR